MTSLVGRRMLVFSVSGIGEFADKSCTLAGAGLALLCAWIVPLLLGTFGNGLEQWPWLSSQSIFFEFCLFVRHSCQIQIK